MERAVSSMQNNVLLYSSQLSALVTFFTPWIVSQTHFSLTFKFAILVSTYEIVQFFVHPINNLLNLHNFRRLRTNLATFWKAGLKWDLTYSLGKENVVNQNYPTARVNLIIFIVYRLKGTAWFWIYRSSCRYIHCHSCTIFPLLAYVGE